MAICQRNWTLWRHNDFYQLFSISNNSTQVWVCFHFVHARCCLVPGLYDWYVRLNVNVLFKEYMLWCYRMLYITLHISHCTPCIDSCHVYPIINGCCHTKQTAFQDKDNGFKWSCLSKNEYVLLIFHQLDSHFKSHLWVFPVCTVRVNNIIYTSYLIDFLET